MQLNKLKLKRKTKKSEKLGKQSTQQIQRLKYTQDLTKWIQLSTKKKATIRKPQVHPERKTNKPNAHIPR